MSQNKKHFLNWTTQLFSQNFWLNNLEVRSCLSYPVMSGVTSLTAYVSKMTGSVMNSPLSVAWLLLKLLQLLHME